MFAFKKKYYLFVENTKDIDFRKLKLFNKYIIIYRKQTVNENLDELLRFRKQCRTKRVEFFVKYPPWIGDSSSLKALKNLTHKNAILVSKIIP